jgi:L-lactate dehydrogenase complex protein LldE
VSSPKQRPRVGLFVTCLVDIFRPSVGLAAVKLLEEAGCDVAVPEGQTCCGQPAYNSGDNGDTRDIAKRTIVLFEPFDYVVVPSGSCGGMIKEHYPELLAAEPAWAHRAKMVAGRTYELISFLHDVRGMRKAEARYDGTVTYHDSCSGLRELGVKAQPRSLLRTVKGATLVELPGAETCCGFGGTFCVKYPEISDKMVAEKAADIVATGADTLAAGDMGCLMNMAGKLKRDGHAVAVRHIAEILAGVEAAPIAAADDPRAQSQLTTSQQAKS